ncbi:unnamed protein product [Lymnaea stagnalis]|uniref:Coiled-coil domain-containing protein 181 n=1 Tax=Lymnaea stagnalis TaxID=6523 RepID=A0AAV2HZI5_LYMST
METVALENDNKNIKNVEIYPSYEDDFEKDSDTFTKDSSSHKVSSDDDQDIIAPPHIKASPPPPLLIEKEEKEVEKGQLEVNHGKPEARGKERSLDEPSDSEPENDAYNFTEDQQRAMMELMVQKQEDGDLIDEEPPEYNVKGRLEQLNAELAKEPTPLEKERETRVGFKPEIVDLVAPPPPDFSDDDSRPNSARGQEATPSTTQNGNHQNKDSDEHVKDNSKQQYVVERDGNFYVLSADELTPSERAMLLNDDSKVKKVRYPSDNKKKSENPQLVSKSNNVESEQIVPQPPPRPRPKTAANGPRRNVMKPSARPKSANNPNDETSNNVDNFNYKSPYAMTPAQKEEAKREAQKQEEKKLKKERKKQEEEEERRKESMDAFQAWLDKKKEEKKKKGNEENSLQSEQERQEENEKAYKTWLKEKRTQGKREKLLKKRQQQDQMEGYFIRSKEECERAFNEWLKKKKVESKMQHAMEKQKIRAYKIHMRRSKKTQALLKALKEAEGSQYLDYYGYRY